MVLWSASTYVRDISWRWMPGPNRISPQASDFAASVWFRGDRWSGTWCHAFTLKDVRPFFHMFLFPLFQVKLRCSRFQDVYCTLYIFPTLLNMLKRWCMLFPLLIRWDVFRRQASYSLRALPCGFRVWCSNGMFLVLGFRKGFLKCDYKIWLRNPTGMHFGRLQFIPFSWLKDVKSKVEVSCYPSWDGNKSIFISIDTPSMAMEFQWRECPPRMAMVNRLEGVIMNSSPGWGPPGINWFTSGKFT